MNARLLMLAVAFCISVKEMLFAASLTYQPSPYRGTDVWLSSYYDYSSDYGVDDATLAVGGWGDYYWSAIKFDLEGLPSTATSCALYMWAYSNGGSSTPVSMNVYALVNSWDENAGWYNTTWSGYNLGTIPAPTTGQFNGFSFTSVYNYWKDGSIANGGLLLMPTANNNRFNYYHSSDYSVPTYRPYLTIQYTETVTPPSLKLPLPGNRSWVVTTEIGGWDAADPGNQLSTHTSGNYFSIDFGPSSSPSYSGDIPIYAAASGKIAYAGSSTPNGYYVVINHNNVVSESDGYTTRYLHLKYSPSVTTGNNVSQGDLLGYMGDTGQADGVHLHFGVRYDNNGASSVNPLTFVKMEGLILKQYQTAVDGSGNRTSDSYYPSTNTP